MKTLTLTSEQAEALIATLSLILEQGKGVDLWINGNGNDENDPLLLDAEDEAGLHFESIVKQLGGTLDENINVFRDGTI